MFVAVEASGVRCICLCGGESGMFAPFVDLWTLKAGKGVVALFAGVDGCHGLWLGSGSSGVMD